MIEAQQAKIHNNYKNIKLKLLKKDAATWLNKRRLTIHILIIFIIICVFVG
jgi:hypothetical protein